MKTLKLMIAGILFLMASTMKTQVSVNVNIGSPPAWGPAGYTDVRYYYLPDVEAYYDIHTGMFIYYSGGGWVSYSYLPNRYRHYDLYNGYKVVMVDYRGDAPYTNFNSYKIKYKKGYRGPSQKTIGNHPGKGHSGKSPEKQSTRQQNGQREPQHQKGRDQRGGGNKSGGQETRPKQQKGGSQGGPGGKPSQGGGGKGKK